MFDAQPGSGEALSIAEEVSQDPDELERLGAQLRVEAAHLAAAECRWLLRLEEFDRRGGWAVPGMRSCAHWLGWACGLGPEAARERLRVARSLVHLPQLTAAFAGGELSYSKVRALTRVATPDNESVLVTMAQSATGAQLEEVVRGYRRSRAAEEARAAHSLFEQRSVRWHYDDDGMLRLSARLPAEEGAQVVAALRAYEQTGTATSPAGSGTSAAGGDEDGSTDGATDGATKGSTPPGPGVSAEAADVDRPTLPDAGVSAEASEPGPTTPAPAPPHQPVALDMWDAAPPAQARAADALIALAETAAQAAPPAVGSDGEELRHVVVHVDGSLLVDPSGASGGERGELADGHLLATETIRRLACDSGVSLSAHREDGSPLDAGRRTRRLPRRLRRALARRDRGCRFPGCPADRFVDAHHVTHWADGGPTDLANLLMLCRFHHRLLHEAGFAVTLDSDGTAHFFRPDGTPLPPSPAPHAGDPAEVVTGNRHHGAAPTTESLVPEWDGRPQDLDAAIEVLAWHTDHGTAAVPATTS